MILLDTDTCVDIIRRRPIATAHLSSIGSGDVALPTIVVAELWYGALKSERAETKIKTEAFLATFAHVPFDSDCAWFHADVRRSLNVVGLPIGANDLLVAATALAHGATLVTANRREYERVAGLRLDTWR